MVKKTRAIVTAAAAILAAAAVATPANATVYVVNGTGGLSANGTTVYSPQVALAAMGHITKVIVKITNLTSAAQGEVVLNVRHGGQTITLANGSGGTHDLDGNYTFDATASSTLLKNGGLTGGDVRFSDAQGAVYDFVAGSFTGLDANGNYWVQLQDKTANGNTTSLSRWQLLVYVPEPATWAMMLGGFGFVGAMMRRRKPAKASLSLA